MSKIRFFRYPGAAVFAGLLCLSAPKAGEAEEVTAKKPIAVEEYQLFEGIIEPIVVTVDSSYVKLTLEHRVNRDLLELDPSCFNHDIFMHMQKAPLISSGLFASQISINGNRPEDTQIEIDRILKVYDWGKIQNVFGLFDPSVFGANLKRFGYRADGGSGFSRIDLTTNPRKQSSLALRFFDFSALTNYSLLNSNFFSLGKISWLDQIINRILGNGFVCPHSQEFFTKMSFGPQRCQVSSNFWWFREGSYIKTDVITDPGVEKTFQTKANWLNEKELMAFWLNNGVIVNSKLFLELAFSVYDTYRFDNAKGKSGMVGIVDPTDLYMDLHFKTRTVNSMAELSYFLKNHEVNLGIKISKIKNHLSFHSWGYFYPGFYGSQRGDEISPEEIKNGYNGDDVLESSYWTNVKTKLIGLQIMAGLVSSHRTGYSFGLSPRIQIGYPLSISFLDDPRLILSLGGYRQFPGAERVYVTMYPVSESNGKCEENYLFALGFRSDQLHFTLSGSRIRNLYSPGYANSKFSSVYANGYTAGFEIGMKRRMGKIRSEVDYGYGIAINNQEGIEYRSVYDPGHNAAFSFIYRPNEKFIMTAIGRFSEGQRIYRLLGREETSEGYMPIWDSIPNSDRLPAMWRISLGGTVFLSDNVLISLYVVNFPGYPCAVMYEGWDPKKRNFVKYPFIVGLGTELNF